MTKCTMDTMKEKTINDLLFYLGVRSQTTKRSNDVASPPVLSTSFFKTKDGNNAVFIIHSLVPYKTIECGFVTKILLFSKYIDTRSKGM